jgi:hypothetical protein
MYLGHVLRAVGPALQNPEDAQPGGIQGREQGGYVAAPGSARLRSASRLLISLAWPSWAARRILIDAVSETKAVSSSFDASPPPARTATPRKEPPTKCCSSARGKYD